MHQQISGGDRTIAIDCHQLNRESALLPPIRQARPTIRQAGPAIRQAVLTELLSAGPAANVAECPGWLLASRPA